MNAKKNIRYKNDLSFIVITAKERFLFIGNALFRLVFLHNYLWHELLLGQWPHPQPQPQEDLPFFLFLIRENITSPTITATISPMIIVPKFAIIKPIYGLLLFLFLYN